MATASSTSSNLSISCSSEYKDYSYNKNHDIWSLVSLKAPCHEEDPTEKRAAMDIVAVIDKSGSMSGEKLRLVKRTLEFVITQLCDKDRLALITYDTDVYVDFHLMNMTSGNKETALGKISVIRDGTCTNLCGGLMKGLCEIINRRNPDKNDVASVLLFTDGLANRGIQNAAGIVAAMKNPKKFDGPSKNPPQEERHRSNPQAPAPHTAWLKNIFSGTSQKQTASNAPVEEAVKEVRFEEPSGTPTEAEASVYAFGFGGDHDAEMLKQISDAGNGMYYFIETEDKIGESFAHCLGGLMSTVAQGIMLEVTMEQGVAIREIHSARPFDQNGDESVKVNIGDLQSEESRDIVIHICINNVFAPYDTTPQILFKANVDYFNVVSNNLESATGSLSVLRPEKEQVHDESSVSAKVTKEKCRVNMTKAMKEANRVAETGDYHGTNVLLTEQIDMLRNCKQMLSYHNGPVQLVEFDAMADDLDECRMNSNDAESYNLRGKNLNMNRMQQYECQRSAMPDAKAYKSKSKQKAVFSSRSFFKK